MSSTSIKINQQRLDHLLKLFNFTKNDVLNYINSNLKRTISKEKVFNEEINLSVLRKIDKLFKQDLSYYTNPNDIESDESSSIFFRKKHFNARIAHADRLRVNAIERDSHYLNALVKLSSYPLNALPSDNYTLNEKPEQVAQKAREKFYPQEKHKDDKAFLKAFINKLSEQNIMVFEFIEHPNLTHKSSIDGFFIAPNVIAIKRQQGSLKREIFTLAHELGHYLLKKEELDQTVVDQCSENKIEKWCNAFAFTFLVGLEKQQQLQRISNFSLLQEKIKEITREQHISRLAVFTHLFLHAVISKQQYEHLKKDLDEEYKRAKALKDRLKTIQKEQGGKQSGSIPRPIRSSLEENIYRNAFLNGVIDEYEVLKRFNAKDIDKLIYG